MQPTHTPAASSARQGRRRNGVVEWEAQAQARRHVRLTIGTTDHRPRAPRLRWFEIPLSHETAWILAMAIFALLISGARLTGLI